jgi:hypothetical protein
LLRALAAGSACVVSDAGSLSEVGRDAALFVPTDATEVDAVRNALVRLHDEPALARRLRHNAASWIRAHHTLREAADGYASAIALTVAHRRRSHGSWRDAAVFALTSAADEMEISDDAVRRWAQTAASIDPRGRTLNQGQ